jgi:hypothetical protein
MKIKEFISEEIDKDVCDDYDERSYIGFSGPLELTEEGKREFEDVLNYEVDGLKEPAIVHADKASVAERIRTFFFSAAGYCSETDYVKWFK